MPAHKPTDRPELEAFQSRRKRINHRRRLARPNACPLSLSRRRRRAVRNERRWLLGRGAFAVQFAGGPWSSRITGHACWCPQTWTVDKPASAAAAAAAATGATNSTQHRRTTTVAKQLRCSRRILGANCETWYLLIDVTREKWYDTWYLGS